MEAQKLSAQEIIQFIGNAEKKTRVKVTLSGMPSFKAAGFLAENGCPNFKALANKRIQVLGDFHTHYSLKIIIGDWQAVRPLLSLILCGTPTDGFSVRCAVPTHFSKSSRG